jgi:uncharacterized protein YcfJ
MRKSYLTAALAASIAVTGCATPRYGYNDPYNNDPYYNQRNNNQAEGAVAGGAIGAVGGAVAGAVLPGVNPVTGAVVGGIAGAVLGAVINNRQYYRDTRGYCYYVDRNGNPIYDYNTRC